MAVGLELGDPWDPYHLKPFIDSTVLWFLWVPSKFGYSAILWFLDSSLFSEESPMYLLLVCTRHSLHHHCIIDLSANPISFQPTLHSSQGRASGISASLTRRVTFLPHFPNLSFPNSLYLSMTEPWVVQHGKEGSESLTTCELKEGQRKDYLGLSLRMLIEKDKKHYTQTVGTEILIQYKDKYFSTWVFKKKMQRGHGVSMLGMHAELTHLFLLPRLQISFLLYHFP